MKKTIIFLPIIVILVAMTLNGCSSLNNQSAAAADGTETLTTPISLPTQLSIQTRVDSQTCLVAEKATIQTDELQGELIAWSPQRDELAIIQPVNQYSGWYIGDVLIFNAEKNAEQFTSEDEAVFGDLAWSPDGSALAYIILDQDENIYTVKLLTPADGLTVDIFGDIVSAKTNDFASLKGIRGWSNDSNLTVTSSCGTDCVRVFEYNPVSNNLLQQVEMRANADTSLVLQNEMASPDGRWTLSVDDKDNLWLTDTNSNQISLLLTAIEAVEIKWSKDSIYLAIRIADKVMIYKVGCSQ